ncbi:putative trichohyalin [Cocos nucifera]|uniref:Putative trichohyalin n=1 Tax=Cocos nucifera TaxID=13894 RepID=A0A8K0I9W8_COCNU|nr:putative trichohyalin [Cocos nucifera]
MLIFSCYEEVGDDFERLQDWVRFETEKYATVLEQRHYTEMEAFTEQLRVKDGKLEAFRWQLLSMELESKRLQSHMEGLDRNLSHFKEENLKLEALLLDKEKELKSLKDKIRYLVQRCQKNNSNYFPRSEVKLTKRIQREKDQESKTNLVRDTQKAGSLVLEMDAWNASEETQLIQLESHRNRELMCRVSTATDTAAISPTYRAQSADNFEGNAITCVNETPLEEPKRGESISRDEAESIILTSPSPKEEIEEEKEVTMDPGNVPLTNSFQEDADIDDKYSSVGPSIMKKDSSWRMDIHALGVSYKIKRLKQQLLVLEKLTASQAMEQPTTKDGTSKDEADENRQQEKGFMEMMVLLSDNLGCKLTFSSLSSYHVSTRTTELEAAGIHQLAGQRNKPKHLNSFWKKPFSCKGFNMRLFADIVRTLLQEILKGLEVRIARAIGDLEGTLASDGILHR